MNVPSKAMTVSKDCQKADGEYHCQAVRGLSNANLANIRFENGGANLGGLICRKLGAAVVLGTHEQHGEQHDEQLLCAFSDGSFVTADSLHAHALENDQRKGR